MKKRYFLFFLSFASFEGANAANTFLYHLGNIFLYLFVPKQVLSCLNKKYSYYINIEEKNKNNENYVIIPVEAFYKNPDVLKYETKDGDSTTREGYIQVLKMIILLRNFIILNNVTTQEKLVTKSKAYVIKMAEEFSTDDKAEIEYNHENACNFLYHLTLLIYDKYIKAQYMVNILLFAISWTLFLILCVMIFGQFIVMSSYTPLATTIICGYVIFNSGAFIFDPFIIDVVLPITKNPAASPEITQNGNDQSFMSNTSNMRKSLREENENEDEDTRSQKSSSKKKKKKDQLDNL